jgi:hypothetical protein
MKMNEDGRHDSGQNKFGMLCNSHDEWSFEKKTTNYWQWKWIFVDNKEEYQGKIKFQTI